MDDDDNDEEEKKADGAAGSPRSSPSPAFLPLNLLSLGLLVTSRVVSGRLGGMRAPFPRGAFSRVKGDNICGDDNGFVLYARGEKGGHVPE